MPSHAHLINQDQKEKLGYFQEFCCRTSLHGWNLCLRPNTPWSHTLFWLIIIAVSLAGGSFMLSLNIDEFRNATVAYNLQVNKLKIFANV